MKCRGEIGAQQNSFFIILGRQIFPILVKILKMDYMPVPAKSSGKS